MMKNKLDRPLFLGVKTQYWQYLIFWREYEKKGFFTIS